jgi:three-Cys-motif partner protein
VELYRRYLATYLNILSRAPAVSEIYIFDLLCGEGVYSDKEEGSPLAALTVIQEHYVANNNTCPKITLLFNDSEPSNIERDVLKIDRVKEFCEKRFTPPSVRIRYYKHDFSTIFKLAVEEFRNNKGCKGLFFIDPYGYKEVHPRNIREALDGGHSEVILFVPASHMYRFAQTSAISDFPGSEPLREFLLELFEQDRVEFVSVLDFLDQTKKRFKQYLSDLGVFVDTFLLERDAQNVYALFFFTSHIRGFERMLETKWKIDDEQGSGFRKDKNLSLFSGVLGSDFPNLLEDFIRSTEFRTNIQVHRFGLENGYLPKHVKQVFDDWKQTKPDFDVFSRESVDERVKGYYLGDKPAKRVGFRFIKQR